MRRPDGARGQHDLAPRRDAFHPPAALIFNPADAPVLDQQAAYLCPHAQLKIVAREDGFQEGLCSVPANAALLVDDKIARALVIAAIEIVRARDAGLPGRGLEGVQDCPAHARRFHPPFAARAMQRIGAQIVILGFFEVRQDFIPAPAHATRLAPAVIIRGLTAHIDHAVDGRTAAQHPAARIIYSAAIQPGLGFGLEAPVHLRVADTIEITDRDMDPGVGVLAAGLQQQHRGVLRRGQPVGERAARRARADDDVVECLRAHVVYGLLDPRPSRAASLEALNSPTIPRLNSSTQTMKISPVSTVTGKPVADR